MKPREQAQVGEERARIHHDLGDPYLGGQGSLSFISEPLLLLLIYAYFSQIENDLEFSDRFKL